MLHLCYIRMTKSLEPRMREQEQLLIDKPAFVFISYLTENTACFYYKTKYHSVNVVYVDNGS
jgi:hypothetical protein